MANSKINDQGKVYRYIIECVEKNGRPPTYREIKDALGYSSTSMVHRRIEMLVEERLIKIEPGKHRGITVLRRGGRMAR